MELIYTKASKPVKKDCYVVKFGFEHGDADECTSDNMDVRLNKEEFKEYVEKVDEISDMITVHRRGGESLPDNFEEIARYKGVCIPVELDCYAKMHMSDYYASMSIEEITYFDENGDKFDVEIKW